MNSRFTSKHCANWTASQKLADQVVMGSVVPSINDVYLGYARNRLGVEPLLLKTGAQVGVEVAYQPPTAVGADRIANAVAVIQKYGAPAVVVDFGTATTFDVIDANGVYAGGSILPGVKVSAEALAGRAAKLPPIELRAPERAIGRNTVESLESGIVLGYAGAVDSLAGRILSELGNPETPVISTGGLGSIFIDVCESIQAHDELLTLDGLRICADRLS